MDTISILQTLRERSETGLVFLVMLIFFFFQAEDGIRACLLSRGLGDVYKRQGDYQGI